jgi:pimeloyl-ACP methyl ester carboxylesterase
VNDIWVSDEGRAAVHALYTEILDRWPVPGERRRVSTRQGETFVVACGPASAAPVVLLQGSGANAAMWMRDIAAWAEHLRVYAVDVIGEPGFSDPSRPALTSEAYHYFVRFSDLAVAPSGPGRILALADGRPTAEGVRTAGEVQRPACGGRRSGCDE